MGDRGVCSYSVRLTAALQTRYFRSWEISHLRQSPCAPGQAVLGPRRHARPLRVSLDAECNAMQTLRASLIFTVTLPKRMCSGDRIANRQPATSRPDIKGSKDGRKEAAAHILSSHLIPPRPTPPYPAPPQAMPPCQPRPRPLRRAGRVCYQTSRCHSHSRCRRRPR